MNQAQDSDTLEMGPASPSPITDPGERMVPTETDRTPESERLTRSISG